MCNAYNHPPGCNCGWGGVKYDSVRTSTGIIITNTDIKKVFKVKLSLYNGKMEKVIEISPKLTVREKELLSETKPTICKYCGAEVFFYQNENGSKVFFEHLGIPWTKHECDEYKKYKEQLLEK